MQTYPREFPPKRRRKPRRRAALRIFQALPSSPREGFAYYGWRRDFDDLELDFALWSTRSAAARCSSQWQWAPCPGGSGRRSRGRWSAAPPAGSERPALSRVSATAGWYATRRQVFHQLLRLCRVRRRSITPATPVRIWAPSGIPRKNDRRGAARMKTSPPASSAALTKHQTATSATPVFRRRPQRQSRRVRHDRSPAGRRSRRVHRGPEEEAPEEDALGGDAPGEDAPGGDRAL